MGVRRSHGTQQPDQNSETHLFFFFSFFFSFFPFLVPFFTYCLDLFFSFSANFELLFFASFFFFYLLFPFPFRSSLSLSLTQARTQGGGGGGFTVANEPP